jgi:hypothetical protein
MNSSIKSTNRRPPTKLKNQRPKQYSNQHMMTELLSIDAQIHNLEAEIENSDPSLAAQHHLAAKHDILATLYARKSDITRQPGDREAATRNNIAAIQYGRRALTSDLLENTNREEIGSQWYFQGARLAWRSQVVGYHGSGGNTSVPSRIDQIALDDAIAAYDNALTELPSRRSSLRREASHNRANLLGARFDLNRSADDINDAIRSGDAALVGARSNTLPAVSNDVGVLYQQRGRLNSNVADLQHAVELGVQSIADDSCPERIRVERFLNLYVSRKLLYTLTRQTQQLEASREELLSAVTLSEQGHGHKKAHILVRLATVAHLLAIDTGNAEYHAEAIHFAQLGLAHARTDDVADEHAELIFVMATTLSETDAQERSIEELANILKEGRNPI